MGFGSFINKTLSFTGLGDNFLGTGRNIVGGHSGVFSGDKRSGGIGTVSQGEVTASNVFSRLSPEQQKDLLINNPNIVTALGEQQFDPLTNTITLTESDFTKDQRLRQEALAAALSGSLSGQLPGATNEELRDATFQQGKELLDPEFEAQRRNLEQQLADEGLVPGSEAYNERINRLEASQGSQLRQLSLASVSQGIQTAEMQRQNRFNEIAALLGEQQVGGIGFGQFQPQRSGLDLFGAEQAALNRQFQAEQARKERSAAQRRAIIGAVGSFGSSAAGALAASDINLKENIERVGVSESGIPIYQFEYIDKSYGEGRYEGVMAQDIQDIIPEAVTVGEGNLLAVNYSLIDVDFRRLD